MHRVCTRFRSWMKSENEIMVQTMQNWEDRVFSRATSRSLAPDFCPPLALLAIVSNHAISGYMAVSSEPSFVYNSSCENRKLPAV